MPFRKIHFKFNTLTSAPSHNNERKALMDFNSLLDDTVVFDRLKSGSKELSVLVSKIMHAHFKKKKVKSLYPEISKQIETLTQLGESALKQLDASDKAIREGVLTMRTPQPQQPLKVDPLTSQLTLTAEANRLDKARHTARLLDEVDKQNTATVAYVLQNNAVTRAQLEQNLYVTYPQILSTLSQMMLLTRNTNNEMTSLLTNLERLSNV